MDPGVDGDRKRLEDSGIEVKGRLIVLLVALAVVVIFGLGVQYVRPNSFEEVEKLLNSGQVAQALPVLQELANDGHSKAMIRLADLELSRTGRLQGVMSALGWYEEAAKKGNYEAMMRLTNYHCALDVERELSPVEMVKCRKWASITSSMIQTLLSRPTTNSSEDAERDFQSLTELLGAQVSLMPVADIRIADQNASLWLQANGLETNEGY